MNGMMYHYGATTDYDEWAKLTGDQSWAWDKLGAYFRKFEKHTPNNSYPVDQSQRSTTGVVDVGHGAWTSPLTADFVKACGETGIPATGDVNRIDYAIGATRISKCLH
jgi:choline dehydrogenase